jgi:hypothetical protein
MLRLSVLCNGLGSSVADPDPGSGAFLTPGPRSGIGVSQIPDLGSQIHISENLVTISGVTSTKS